MIITANIAPAYNPRKNHFLSNFFSDVFIILCSFKSILFVKVYFVSTVAEFIAECFNIVIIIMYHKNKKMDENDKILKTNNKKRALKSYYRVFNLKS